MQEQKADIDLNIANLNWKLEDQGQSFASSLKTIKEEEKEAKVEAKPV